MGSIIFFLNAQFFLEYRLMSMRLFSPISCGLTSLKHLCPDYEQGTRTLRSEPIYGPKCLWNIDFRYIIDISYCHQMYEI
jgi:hypothetical protein